MADIEIAPLADRLEDDEIAELGRALQKSGASKLPKTEDAASATIAAGIDDEVLAEFLDHLEANDLACDVYVPVDFDGRVEAADRRFGSLSALIDVLDELREDLAIEDDDEADDDEDEDEDEEDEEEGYEISLVEKQLRQVWRYFYDGASSAADHNLALFIVPR